MPNRITNEMKDWLFDLAHGNLTDDRILSGFIRHYALHGLVVDNVVDDIVRRTSYGTEGAMLARQSLDRVLHAAAGIQQSDVLDNDDTTGSSARRRSWPGEGSRR